MSGSRPGSGLRKILLAGIAALAVQAPAQVDFKSMHGFEDKYLKFFVKGLFVKPSTDDYYGGPTINFAWTSNSHAAWKSRFRWEETLFSDAIAGIVKQYILDKPITRSGLDHAFSSGLFGSFQYGWNAIATSGFIVSPCLSFGDYVIAAERFENTGNIPGIENNGKLYRDPAGYFFVAGPAVIASWIPANGLWIDGYFAYEFTAYNVGERNIRNFVHLDGYPDPHFLSLGFDLNHGSNLFAGVKIQYLIDNGSVGTGLTRMDFNLGLNLGRNR